MGEPNLSSVPGILLRTILRFVARAIFLIAGVTLAIGVALTLLSLFLCTWRSARPQRTQAAADLLTAAITFAKTVRS